MAKTALKVLASLIFVCLALLLLLAIILWWSTANKDQANAECSMLIIEKKISPTNVATEYRRACMASKGYGMHPNCYVENYSVASCFIPKWMFWINTV